MTDDYVQVNVRMTRQQRKELKEIADKENKSMNQHIIDSSIAMIDDRTNDRTARTRDRTVDSQIVQVLTKELDKAEKQLETKDQQIDKLQKILDQQQQLNLQTNQQVERLQLETIEAKENKKGFFARLFSS